MDNASNSPSTIGQWVRLDAILRFSGLWLGPAWAVVCGIISSGRFTWNARGLLLAGLAVFLVDGIWATLWAAAGETNWAAIAARWNAAPPPLRPGALPYVRPGAPGDRLARWLSRLVAWWRTELQPVAGTAASSLVLCLALGLALSAILGWQLLALSAAALAVIQIGLVVNRASGQPVPVVKATLEVGLAWLAGQAAFGPVSVLSVLMAATFTLAYTGGLQLVEQQGGLGMWRWAQLSAALILLATRHPLPGLALLFILCSQSLLEPGLQAGRTGTWFVRSNQAWLIAAMLITAFAVR